MNETISVDEMARRWHRALERVLAEGVRIVEIGGSYYATSTSKPLGSYRLAHTADGWTCECPANSVYGMPCKHLAALSAEVDMDLLRDVRLQWEPVVASPTAA